VGRLEELTLSELLRPIEGRLAERARQAGMELTVEVAAAAGEAMLRANPSAVEQILFNLVDNACKYAAGATDRRIHLSAERVEGFVRLAIRDHGPGISPAASRRLFRSFSKSAQEAANTAPGVGLGLALSRRLARDMGARLELDRRTTGGARFVLRLPLVPSAPFTPAPARQDTPP
jgi:signal transduction histidine kinase